MRLGAALGIALVITWVSPTHAQQDNRDVVLSDTYCVNETAVITADGGGVVRAELRSYTDPMCDVRKNRPTGYLAQGLWLLKSDQNGRQAVCASTTDWTYNPKWMSGYSISFRLPGNHYCGAGDYQVRAFGYTYEDGAWRGGYVDSGSIYLH